MTMKDFNLYACGGTGINITNKFIKEGKNFPFIDKIVGIDTSSANPVTDGLYDIELLEGAQGSGGNKKEHGAKYPDFVKQVMAKHEPNKLNIVIYSTAGGTGSGVGPYIVRYLLQKKLPVLSIIVGDCTTVNEQNNTLGTLGSLYNQCKLGVPVVFSYLENKAELTQGEVNTRAVGVIDNALMHFNLDNERIDYADIRHFFYFTDVVEADPILTQLTFMTDSDLPKYESVPVAAISLFNDIDEIKTPYENMLYRKAGIYGENFFKGMKGSSHAVLDHGTTIDSLKLMISEKEKRGNELSGRFKSKDESLFENSDDDGMI